MKKILAAFQFWYHVVSGFSQDMRTNQNTGLEEVLDYSDFDLADRGDHLSVSNVPLAPGKEEAIVDCVAFFYKEGKGGENIRKESERAERSLHNLRDTKR